MTPKRYLSLIVFLFTFTIISPCQERLDASENGLWIGSAIGLLMANLGKDPFRESVIWESISGLSVGMFSVTFLENNQKQAEKLIQGVFNSAPYTAASGAVIGSLMALSKGQSLDDGFINGASFGAMFPGTFTGGIIGFGAGSLYSFGRDLTISERPQVGFAAAGALAGGSLSYIASGSTLTGMQDSARLVGATALASHIGYTLLSANSLVKSVKSGPDYKTHNQLSRLARFRYTAGPALLIGYAKESRDFFLSAGTPEWKDLKNNWNGVFRQGHLFKK
jgi:hypothetical protein